ncbi:MAG: bifunctional ADP-dependent (S)-NAD(P)H-hydrate dehydratase/NAD(P)H-hydrate epimerase [Chloroflexi bacterium RBG_13_51_36]|nr:MAG: bifunctional ADP-dependent (S)-NAD(P)H-hydrate dehydratase/NAD(P)H-hydrate epimerase [Chloroflexi bacterium RBG_13_51_36]
MKVARVGEMKDLDRRAAEEFGISEDLLMENAGQAVYFAMLQEIGIKGNRFLVFCGGGNNGGDGLVVARKIHSNGGEVKVFLLDDEAKFKGAAKKNFEIVSRMPIEMSRVDSIDSVIAELFNCDAVVDAIFGTGLVRKVSGIYKDVIQLINESQSIVFSVDIPSGINGDTGEVMGVAVEADYTVAFGLPKLGNMLYPGYEHCGKLYVSHISFPPALQNSRAIKAAINSPVELPERLTDTHKGSYGKALFIAGSSSYLGAPYFSALSFLKAGGGLSYLATPESISPFIASRGSEIVFVPQKETSSGSIALDNKDELPEFSQTVDMVVLGPGLSLASETQELVRKIAPKIDKPLIIDGDGITAIAEDPGRIRKRQAPTILTPHLGEMSRIAKMEISEISKNKIDVLQRTAKELNAIIILKGAHSLIGYPDGTVFINLSGNSGMATAGSGDILTGTIAAMYGLGLPLEDAVRMGVFIHGFSGDVAAVDKGEDGITAQDILDYLPETVKLFRDNFAEISENLYESIFVI